MEYLLSTNNLTKRFKNQTAVDNISLHLKRGAIYGLIGENGAGKTTFLKMISGLSKPTSGDISLFGYSGQKRKRVLSRIGVLIEAPGLYPSMSAYDNLKLKCICVGIKKHGYIESILQTVGLEKVGKKKVKNFSLGMKQRLGIGMALIGEPDLLTLDEPINGLDPQGIVEIRDTILQLNREKNITMIISSHILEELSKIATNYGFIHNGRLVKELTNEELAAECNERIEIKMAHPEQALPILDQLGFTRYKMENQNTIRVYERLNDSGIIVMELAKQNIMIQSIGITNESIENYFLNLTGGAHHA